MSVCTSPAAESFGDVSHRCQMSRDERWAVLNRNTFQDILNSILTQTPSTPLIFSSHSTEEVNSLAKARLRKLCGNGSGSTWSENDRFEDMDLYDRDKIMNTQETFTGRNGKKNNVIPLKSQKSETSDFKKDVTERRKSNTISPRHVMTHVNSEVHDYFDNLTLPQTDTVMMSGDPRSCSKSSPGHILSIPGSAKHSANDPKLCTSTSPSTICESDKSNIISTDFIENTKTSVKRNHRSSGKSFYFDNTSYFSRDNGKYENAAMPEFSSEGKKSEGNSCPREETRSSLTKGNKKVFGRHSDVIDLSNNDSLDNTDREVYHSTKNNNCLDTQLTHKRHSPRASITYNSPPPTTTESSPFRIPLPFVHPKLKPIGLEPTFSDVIPRFQNPREFNELDVYRIAFNLCSKDSELLNSNERNYFQDSFNQLHETGIRRDLEFERNIKNADFDIFSQYTFGSKFEFFNMNNPLRLFPEDMPSIKSEFDHHAKSIGNSESGSRNICSDYTQGTLKIEKPCKIERSDQSNSSLPALYVKSPTKPSSLSVQDDSHIVGSLRNESTTTSHSGKVMSDSVALEESKKQISVESNKLSDIVPSEAVKKSKNHSVLAILGPLLSEETDHTVSPALSSEDTCAVIRNSNIDTVKYSNDDSSHCFRSPNMFKRNCVTGIYGSTNFGKKTTGVWLAVSKDVLYNLMDRLLNGERSQLMECTPEEHGEDGHIWSVGFSRSKGGGGYPGMSRSEPIETWLRRNSQIKTNSFRSVRYQVHCQRPFNSDSSDRHRRVTQKERKHILPSSRPEGIVNVHSYNVSGSCLGRLSDVAVERTCQPTLSTEPVNSDITGSLTSDNDVTTAVRANSDVTKTPVLRSLLDDDDVFTTSPTQDHQYTTDAVSPVQGKLTRNKFNFTSSAPIMTSSSTIETTARRQSLGDSDTDDLNGYPPSSCVHPGTYVVARKRKLCELLTCTDHSLDGATLSKSEVGAVMNKPEEGGAGDYQRLRSMKWKSSMLLRLREEINSETTPSPTN